MATSTNKRFGNKVNPYQFTPSHIKALEKMGRWYGEKKRNTFFEIHLGPTQKDILSYSGESWGEYIGNYIERERYGEVANLVLNELRSIYLQYIGESK